MVVHIHVQTETKRFEEEYITGSNTSVAAIAPHSGKIERYTDEQAELFSRRLDCPAWICRGDKDPDGAYDEFHVTSTEIDPDSYEFLHSLIDQSPQYTVAFHGWEDQGIAVGGSLDTELKNELARQLEAELGVSTSVPSIGSYSGTRPDNVVNQVSSSAGIQLEQSMNVRENLTVEVVRVAGRFVRDL